LQRFHGSPADRCRTNNANIIPTEVVHPTVLSRVEKCNVLIRQWIQRFTTGTLVKRARHAGQGQVLGDSLSVACTRYHVIGVKLRLLSFLRQSAILASGRGALNNQTP
jgi:hypothetical protein